MSTAREADTPIVDADEARRFDLASRTLRITLVMTAVQWPFLAALLAIFTDVPRVVAALVALAGVLYTVAVIRYFARIWRRRLVNFADPITSKPQIPRRLRVNPFLRHGPVSVASVEIAIVVGLLNAHH